MKKLREIPKAQSIKVNFVMNAILKISAYIFPLITFPYISRILGADGNGKITFATAAISYFSMFAQLGIPTYGTRVCAACRNDSAKLNKTVQELVIINSVTVLLTYIVFSLCLVIVPRFQTDKWLFIITSATILLNFLGMEWLFSALEQYAYITLRNLFFKVVAIVLMFAFVHKPEDYIIYGAINVVGTCGSNFLNLIYANRFLSHKLSKDLDLKQHIKPLFTFFMLTVSVSIYTHMDSVMLGFISTDAEVGYYAAATKMKMILVNTVTALGTVLLPRMSKYIADGKVREFTKMATKSFNFIFDISFPITIYFSVMAYAVIGFLAGDGYTNAIVPMQVITPTIVFISLSNITGMQILVPTKREKITTISTVTGAVVNLIVNALAIPSLGATGAALGTVIAEASVLIFQFVYLRKELPGFLSKIQYWKIIICNVGATCVLLLLKPFITGINYFLDICDTGVIFFGTYVALMFATKEKLFIESGIGTIKKGLNKVKAHIRKDK